MGWEIAAVWVDPDANWCWTWRRVEDDSGRIIEESSRFPDYEECIEDAQAHGLDYADCVLTAQPM
jgi:hypothetical protein